MSNLIALPGGNPAEIVEPEWNLWTEDALKIRHASAAWKDAVAGMRAAETLSIENSDALRRYGEYVALHREATQKVASEGAVKLRIGKQPPMWNLWLSAAQKYEAMLLTLETELGLSPAARGKVAQAKRGARKTSAADSFLGVKRG